MLGLVLIRQSRKTLYLDGGRLLVAPTDWRILCTHYPFNFGSVAAVDRKLFRSADAWDGFSFAGSPTGEEGGKEKPWKQRLRSRSARGEKEKAMHRNCAKKRNEEETCARDSAQAAEAPWRARWVWRRR